MAFPVVVAAWFDRRGGFSYTMRVHPEKPDRAVSKRERTSLCFETQLLVSTNG
jgi:hypothetical protein